MDFKFSTLYLRLQARKVKRGMPSGGEISMQDEDQK